MRGTLISVSVVFASLAAGSFNVCAQDDGVDAGAGIAAIIEIPERLERDEAAGALGVLTRHCARCHQSGHLQGQAPAAGFDGILDLDGLLRRPDLVIAGRPDASRLYQAMLTRHMPHDVFQEGKPGETPSAAEIAQVRNWITDAEALKVCENASAQIASEAERMTAWLEELASAQRERTRFITLGHLARGCGSDGLSAGFRAGVLEAVSSASWSDDPAAAVRPVDGAGDLLAVDLDGLGWSTDAWLAITQWQGAGFPVLERILPLSLIEATRTSRPVVAGDFLAAALMNPAVYKEVMGFPITRRVFAAVIGARIGTAGRPVLAYSDKGSSAAGARLVMRREHARGNFAWWSFHSADAGKSAARRMMKEFAAGEGVQAVSSRVVFRLPGGFLAAASFDADGVLVGAVSLPAGTRASKEGDDAPPEGRWPDCCEKLLPSALSAFDDQARSVAKPDSDAGPELFTQGGLDARLASDRNAIIEARRRVGLPEGLLETGAVGGLAREYRVPIDLARAAGELGVSISRLKSLLADVDGEMLPVARRLEQGLVTRQELAALSRVLFDRGGEIGASGRAEADGLPRQAGSPSNIAESGPPVGLSIWTDKFVYEAGETTTVFATADRDCHLTLINVDQAGQATVLYPSEFHPGNALKAGEIVQVPGADAGYELIFAEPGREHFIGICMEGERRFPAGIGINYERQRFTMLGKWNAYLETYLAAEAAERANVGKKKRKRRARWRQKEYHPPPRTTRLPLPQLRSAITVEIR